MLAELTEVEGAQAARVLARLCQPGGPAQGAGFRSVDYLFHGRAATAPSVWLAGAVLGGGKSATGSGLTPEAALWGIAGEAAEAQARATLPPPGPGLHGYGAQTEPGLAADHARHEVCERLVIREFWAGQRAGRRMDAAEVARRLAGIGVTRFPGRPVIGVEIDTTTGAAALAASFDAAGGGFCFGCAFRDAAPAAFRAAVMELVQAEFGLSLALMKRDRSGASGLPPGDRLTLRFAEALTRDRFEAALAAPPPATAAPVPPVETRVLGRFDGGLYVAAAQLPGAAAFDWAASPFAGIDPFTVPA